MLKSFSKDIIAYGFITGLNKSLNFIFVPIFSRHFSESEYGIIDLVTTVILFMTLLGTFQLEAAIGRYFYEEEDEYRHRRNLSTGLWSIFVVGLFFAAIIYLIHQPLSLYLFDREGYESLLLITLFIVPAANIYTYFIALFRYLNQPFLFGFFTLAQVVLTFGFTLFFIFGLDWSLNGVFLAQLVSYAMVAVTMTGYFLKKEILRFQWHWPSLKRYLKFSLPLLPSALFGWANSYANRFIMLQFLSLAEIGLYTVAIKIASVIKLMEEGVKMTWSPFLYQNLKKPNHREIYTSIFKFLTYISISLIIALTLFTPEIIRILVPSNYYSIEPILILVILSFGINMLVQIVLIGPAITKKTIYTSIIGIISMSVNLISLYFLIQEYGLVSVPISLLLGVVVQFILGWITTEYLYPIGFELKSFLYPAVLCGLVVVACLTFSLPLYARILIFVLVLVSFELKSKFGTKLVKKYREVF